MNSKKISISIILLAAVVATIALVLIHNRYKTVGQDPCSGPSLGDRIYNPCPVDSGSSNGTGGITVTGGHGVIVNGVPLDDSTSTTSSPTSAIKPSLLLKVPFTPQAPTANWDTIHNEDCEEASAVMANAYYNGPHDIKLDPAYVEGQLTKLTDWEMQAFGYNLDISSEETVQMIHANYGLQTKIIKKYTIDDIKNELAQNHLVLIPENGQMLGNPNYKQPGPKYHMLVIRGYTPTSIITNDPGTHNGLDYAYSFNTLYNANGDWSHQTNSVDLSKKNIIVVWE